MNRYKILTKMPREFLCFLIVGITCILVPLTAIAQQIPEASNNEEILKVGPYLQAPFNGGMTIRWVTTVPCYSWVTYGKSPEFLSNKVHSLKDGLVVANNRINAIRLKNLDPNTKYYYQVHSSIIEEFHPNKIVYGETYKSPVYFFSTIGFPHQNKRFAFSGS